MGPEAVILSTGTIGDQVEVVAAIDVEVAQRIRRAARRRAGARSTRPSNARRAAPRVIAVVRSAGAEGGSRSGRSRVAAAARGRRAARGAAQRARQRTAKTCAACSKRSSRRSRGTTCRAARRCRPRCSRSSRSSASRRISPARWRARFPPNLNFSAARRFALATIARTVQVTGDRWLETGGRVAFVGPAGVGKTTLFAKLAARWVLRHGPRRVALVSADAVRIGAHEQMHMLGACSASPRTRCTTSPNCRNCSTRCPASSSCSSTPRAPARAIRISRAACACIEPGAVAASKPRWCSRPAPRPAPSKKP